jgi:hypothetical protein
VLDEKKSSERRGTATEDDVDGGHGIPRGGVDGEERVANVVGVFISEVCRIEKVSGDGRQRDTTGNVVDVDVDGEEGAEESREGERAENRVEVKVERQGGKGYVHSAQRARGCVLGITRLSGAAWWSGGRVNGEVVGRRSPVHRRIDDNVKFSR